MTFDTPLASIFSGHPRNLNSHAFFLIPPSGRAPRPVANLVHQSCFHRIVVHVLQFLVQLSFRPYIKIIISNLPDGMAIFKLGPIRWDISLVRGRNLLRSQLFPFVNARADLMLLWKPKHGVNMIQHHNKSKASSILPPELRCQRSDNNAFAHIRAEQLAALVT